MSAWYDRGCWADLVQESVIQPGNELAFSNCNDIVPNMLKKGLLLTQAEEFHVLFYDINDLRTYPAAERLKLNTACLN